MKPTSLRPKDKEKLTVEQLDAELKNLHNRRGIHTRVLTLITTIKDGVDSPLWKHVREKCKEIITSTEALENRADEYKPEDQPIPDRTIWKALGFKKAAKTILAVEDMINNEEGYKESLIKIEKEIKYLAERKSQLGIRT